MKRLIPIFLVALACAGLAAYYHLRPKPWENRGDFEGRLTRAVAPYDPAKKPSRPWLDPAKTAPPLTVYGTFVATSLAGGRSDYLVYLPPGYDAAENREARYPVVYWLHGYGAEPAHGVPGFVETLDQAIRAGVAPPIIGVLPNGLVDSWYCNAADGSQPVESLIVRDLIPHVDATYRTWQSREKRAVEGFSMGGWGAAHLLFKYPHLFCAATLVGGPIHTPSSFVRWHRPQFDKVFGGDVDQFYAEDPVTRARRLEPEMAGLVRVRTLIGAKDGNRGWAIGFHQRLQGWKIRSELTEAPGVEHSDADVYHTLGPGAFGFYRELFADRAAVGPTGGR
jgi:endo-1,4-beta-xylanase